jgi:hypothetical protein
LRTATQALYIYNYSNSCLLLIGQSEPLQSSAQLHTTSACPQRIPDMATESTRGMKSMKERVKPAKKVRQQANQEMPRQKTSLKEAPRMRSPKILRAGKMPSRGHPTLLMKREINLRKRRAAGKSRVRALPLKVKLERVKKELTQYASHSKNTRSLTDERHGSVW